jgi:hypothetical protein
LVRKAKIFLTKHSLLGACLFSAFGSIIKLRTKA